MASCSGASAYGASETCTIAAVSTGTLAVTAFSTENGYDKLSVGGADYHGASGPDGIIVDSSTAISWYSDSSSTESGWEFCLGKNSIFEGILSAQRGRHTVSAHT